jgi:2-C-methyl-D-erythritol 4-phosphate cytidylyltransferase
MSITNSIDLVIPAGGLGTRMGIPTPKQFLHLGGVPLFVHPLRAFSEFSEIASRIIVHPMGYADVIRDILSTHHLEENCILVEGGATRQESVLNGLLLVRTPRVIIHNAAVALVSPNLIRQVLDFNDPCVTTATPLEPNIVEGDSYAERALSRARLRVINSPQSFSAPILIHCHEEAAKRGLSFASDAELMLHFGHKVRLVPGNTRNFKITTQMDLAAAEVLLSPQFLK